MVILVFTLYFPLVRSLLLVFLEVYRSVTTALVDDAGSGADAVEKTSQGRRLVGKSQLGHPGPGISRARSIPHSQSARTHAASFGQRGRPD